MSSLAQEGLKHQTKCYLSAIRHLQISLGHGDRCTGISMSQIDYVLRGIKKHQAPRAADRPSRLPVTPVELEKIRRVWQGIAQQFDTVMLWAACSLAFFGFLRAGELTVPSNRDFNPLAHLCASDVSLNHPAAPTLMYVAIKQSKTDPFRQ